MIEISFVRVDCPYCGLLQKVEASSYPTYKAVFCEGDELRGCEKLFVYKTIVEARGITRKVEGEE